MTDILALLENLSPLILVIAAPLVTVWALDPPVVHVPESGTVRPARAPAVPEPEPPRWRFDRLTPRTAEAQGQPGAPVAATTARVSRSVRRASA